MCGREKEKGNKERKSESIIRVRLWQYNREREREWARFVWFLKFQYYYKNK